MMIRRASSCLYSVILSYDELLAENKQLRGENASLRAELGKYKHIDIDTIPVANESIFPIK